MASAPIKLDPATVEAIARRVVELLARRSLTGEPELVDATQLARRLGVERSWVYTHAIELGAVRLGSGSKPRLRFDSRAAMERMRGGSPGTEVKPEPRTAGRGRRLGPRPGPVSLLPIKGGGEG